MDQTPFSVRVFELKFGLILADALLPPLVSVIYTCADIPMPCTLKLQFTFPFLSVVIFISFLLPSL